jgi:VanZ family protein
MAVIFYLSHQSTVTIPFDAPDYSAHAVGYAALAALYVRALAGGHLAGMRLALLPAATLMAALYGVTDEFHQSFIPGRFPSAADLVADTVGAIVGAGMAAGLGAWIRRRARQPPSTLYT